MQTLPCRTLRCHRMGFGRILGQQFRKELLHWIRAPDQLRGVFSHRNPTKIFFWPRALVGDTLASPILFSIDIMGMKNWVQVSLFQLKGSTLTQMGIGGM